LKKFRIFATDKKSDLIVAMDSQHTGQEEQYEEDANMKLGISSTSYGEAYYKHPVFEKIEHMMDYYGGVSYSCFCFIPNGAPAALNYSSYVYKSIKTTLESIQMLLKAGHISDAFVLIRKLFDTVLVEIYLNVVREEKYDWMENFVVKDVDDWIRKKIRIPRVDKILDVLKTSATTKDLYPYFGWDKYLKTNRELLDEHVHVSSFRNITLNCKDNYIEGREKQLDNALIVLKQIMLVHLSFIFYLNGHYMMADMHMTCLEMGDTPPEGSENWLAKYAQDAFDEFIKPYPKIAEFIKSNCSMIIE